MARPGRPGMSDELRQVLWRMWASGQSFSEIARATGHPLGSIFTVVRQTGGYVPPSRQRRAGTLTLIEREEISRSLGRLASTVCREVNCNRGRRKYRAVDADHHAWRRARRPKRCQLTLNPTLRAYVAACLCDDCSPEQIVGTLRRLYPAESGMRVSHETIYKSLFVQSRGVLARNLQQHLPTRRPTRRNIHNTMTGQWRSQITDAVSIRERPTEVEDRAIPGHREGDLLLGRHWSQIATVVERATRLTVLIKLAGRDMATVTEGLSRTMARLPEQVRKSLTWDRGMELADHKTVTANTGLAAYFADPRSPWQRGTNENTSRLLRQYFPKGRSIAGLTQDDLDALAAKLNPRPRKTLGYDTPADRLQALLR